MTATRYHADQKQMSRAALTASLIIVCVVAAPTLISLSDEATRRQGSDLAARDTKLTGQEAGIKVSPRNVSEADEIAARHEALNSSAALHKALGRVLSKRIRHRNDRRNSETTHNDETIASRKIGRQQRDAPLLKSKKGKPQIKSAEEMGKIQHAATETKTSRNTAVKPVEKGSTKWEREQDDNFFDSLDKQRTRQEASHKLEYLHRTLSEDKRWGKSVQVEHEKVQKAYEDAKKRFAAQRAAAKQYTERTFAAMQSHRNDIEHDSESGFKSIEAKELATEVERDHPHESPQQIAERAMKLLKVVMHGGSSLPAVPSGLGPMR